MTTPDLHAAFDHKFGTTTDWDALPWHDGLDVPDVDDGPDYMTDAEADRAAGFHYPEGL